MNLLNIFKDSLQLPKKQALFRLNRVSMRDTMVYFLLLTFLLMLPDMVQSFLGYQDIELYGMPNYLYFIQLIILYPTIIFLIVVIGISALAGLATLFKYALHRKLAYQQLWKMTAFALTIPMLIYFIFRLFQVDEILINILPLFIYVVLIILMIRVYPKAKK